MKKRIILTLPYIGLQNYCTKLNLNAANIFSQKLYSVEVEFIIPGRVFVIKNRVDRIFHSLGPLESAKLSPNVFNSMELIFINLHCPFKCSK
jgi:hypothetical protein